MRFYADCMVGKLAKWLRILGYDTFYRRKIADPELIEKAAENGGILLTRDEKMLERKGADRYLLIKSDDYIDQLGQVIEEFDLSIEKSRLFTRCTVCNTPTESIDKERVKDRVPPYTYRHHEDYSICRVCDRIYWRGSHVDNTFKRLADKLGIKHRKELEDIS